MPENVGLYRKFEVTRNDGGPPPPAWLVLDVAGDPDAAAVVRAWAGLVRHRTPDFADGLERLAAELESGRHGPALAALMTPR